MFACLLHNQNMFATYCSARSSCKSNSSNIQGHQEGGTTDTLLQAPRILILLMVDPESRIKGGWGNTN